MIRILFLIDCVGSGGKERQLVEQIRGLCSYPEIHLELAVLSDHIFSPYIKGLYVKTHYIKRKRKKDIMALINLFFICKQFQPKIIHSWERMCSIYAVPLSKLFNAVFVNGVVRNAPSYSKPKGKLGFRDRLTFPFSDVILANSKAGLVSYNVSESRGYYIHNGFDFKRIENLRPKKYFVERFQIETDYIVGMVANFNARKDYFTFIAAAKLLLENNDNITFLTVGDGNNALGDESRSTFQECQDMVSERYSPRIKFLGRQDNVESIINVFDVGILLTNQKLHGEGISNVIMEYMALGKPVIATDGGGTGEIVINGKTGYLVSDGDAVAVAKLIDLLVNDNKLARKMGAAGKERLHKEFNITKMTDKYIQLYKKLALC